MFSLEKHWRKQSIEVIVVLDTALTECLCQCVKHSGQILVELVGTLVILVNSLEDILCDLLGVFSVEIGLEVFKMDKVTMSYRNERIDNHVQ